jgi:hypothetical protein
LRRTSAAPEAQRRLDLQDSRRRAGMSPEDRAALRQAQAEHARVAQLRRQGRSREAVDITVKLLAVRRQVQGERHPDYASSLNNLAWLQQEMGEQGRMSRRLREGGVRRMGGLPGLERGPTANLKLSRGAPRARAVPCRQGPAPSIRRSARRRRGAFHRRSGRRSAPRCSARADRSPRMPSPLRSGFRGPCT